VFDPDKKDPTTFAAMIDAYAAAVERMQIARDAIYARTKAPWQQRQARALIALLDAFETILSSDADIEILQTSRHRHLMRRLRALTMALADDTSAWRWQPAGIWRWSRMGRRGAPSPKKSSASHPRPARMMSGRLLPHSARRRTRWDRRRIASLRSARKNTAAPHTDLTLFRQTDRAALAICGRS